MYVSVHMIRVGKVCATSTKRTILGIVITT